MRSWLLAAALLLAALSPAHGQPEPSQDALFAAYLGSPGYKAFLERIFNLGESSKRKAECPSLRLLASDKYRLLQPVRFLRVGTSYNVDRGAWLALAILDRCGTKVTRRALVKALPGANKLEPVLLLPGDFKGDLRLEADAMRIVGPAVMLAGKCQDPTKFRVVDVKARGAGSRKGWSETWTAEACDRSVEVDVSYTRLPDGTTNIAARNARAR